MQAVALRLFAALAALAALVIVSQALVRELPKASNGVQLTATGHRIDLADYA
jgi:hypothetical protein